MSLFLDNVQYKLNKNSHFAIIIKIENFFISITNSWLNNNYLFFVTMLISINNEDLKLRQIYLNLKNAKKMFNCFLKFLLIVVLFLFFRAARANDTSTDGNGHSGSHNFYLLDKIHQGR